MTYYKLRNLTIYRCTLPVVTLRAGARLSDIRLFLLQKGEEGPKLWGIFLHYKEVCASQREIKDCVILLLSVPDSSKPPSYTKQNRAASCGKES